MKRSSAAKQGDSLRAVVHLLPLGEGSGSELVSNLRQRVAELETQVRERSQQLAARTEALILTEDRERRALARDLHDDLGQMLPLLKIKLTSLYAQQDRAKILAGLKDIEKLIDVSNRSLRSLNLQLSPPVLHRHGLLTALQWLAEEIGRLYGLAVELSDDGKPKYLAEVQRITLFHCARELLVNVAKHAGVDRAWLKTLVEGENMHLVVSDEGSGFDPRLLGSKLTGMGLIAVKARMGFIGGEMSLASHEGKGTRITLTAPLLPA